MIIYDRMDCDYCCSVFSQPPHSLSRGGRFRKSNCHFIITNGRRRRIEEKRERETKIKLQKEKSKKKENSAMIYH
jgi:hypothetical protein